MELLEFFGYFAAILMGITLGLLGGGGSILIVPILVYLFSVDPIQATTSSLFIVGATALITSLQYMKRGEVNIKAGTKFALASFLGIYLSRNYILPALPKVIISNQFLVMTSSDLLLVSFAILMILASLAMLKSKNNSDADRQPGSTLKITFQGIIVGVVTGFVGAGGGFLILPVLVNLVGLRMRIAVGTSLMIIAANSLFGFGVSYFGGAQVDWKLQLSILALAVLGSFVGAKFSTKVSEKSLKKGFGVFVLVVGTLIIVERIAFR